MAPRRPIEQGRRVQLVRPLLDESRAAIIAYAQTHDLAWRTDASNASVQYDRNALRHRVLPIIEEHFEGATDRIAAAADHVRQYLDETFNPELAARFERCAPSTSGPGGAIDLVALQDEPSVWRRRIILEALRRWLPETPYTAALAHDVEALLDAQVGRRVEVGTGRVWRERTALRVVPSSAGAERVEAQPFRVGQPVRLPQGVLRVEAVDTRPEPLDTGSPTTEFVDGHAIDGSLIVRTWQDGDRVQPLGMAHTKLVSDLLTDERVPPHRRAEQLVVCDASRIVWVVGHRIAHPVRVRPSTEQILQFQFEPALVESEHTLPSGPAD